MRLNTRQADAAHDIDRHVLVSAGAGTGKTRCVIGRLLYLLGETVAGRSLPPERRLALRDIAAVTFTNAAAADLQRKLRAALREAGRRDEASRVDTARIGTIHGFCGQLLWEFALQVNRAPGLTALDEAETIAAAADAARDALLAALEERSVPGLDRLLAECSVEDVLAYVARLASDADRLSHVGRDPALDEREQALVALARHALGLVAERLAERSAVDFDSMLVVARDLLRDNAAVRRVLQRRIRVLIVDEFQDVDPVQQEIAYLLGEPASGRSDTTRLMLVGDPKQSIFRFRRSDVTLWTRVQRDFESGHGAVHTLTENYRSRQPILALADAVFGAELNEPLDPGGRRGDFEVAYEPLRAADEHRTTEPCVEVLALPATDTGRARSGEDARGIEVAAVASRVDELIRAGAAPGDIAILLSAWGPAEDYARALGARGIRSWTLRNEGYYERREVQDCIVALRAVLDPLDDLALFGFLRSPMVGVKDETLLAVARHGSPPFWRSLGTVETAESELLAFGAGLVRQYGALRDRVPHDELLGDLLAETGYFAYLRLLGDDGAQPEANVRKLVRRLRDWRELTLAGVLRVVDEIREREEGSREGDAPLAARQDAVTITSIHSAKGLEWPVVIWADLTRGVVAPKGALLVGRDTLRLRSAQADAADDDPRFAELRRQEMLEEQAQRKRLWYVAATRAQTCLILSGVPLGALTGRHKGTACEAVLRRLGNVAGPTVIYGDHEGERFTATVRVAPVVPAPAPLPVDPLPVLPIESLAVPSEPMRVAAGRARHSASELLTFSRCHRKHWFAYAAGLREPPINRTTPEFIDAVTRGQIVHDVLEHLREQDELDGLLEDAIGRWDPDAPAPEGTEGLRYRGRLREEIERVSGHPAWRALAEAPGARRELGFVHFVGPERHLHGRIDLMAPRADGLAILDVKTGGQLTPEAARRRAEGYAPQRDVYVGAAEAVSGQQVAEFAFHFSGAGEHVAERVTPELRDAARERVAAAIERIETGERSLTHNDRECRFCGYRAAGWCAGVRSASAESAPGAQPEEPT